MKTIILAVFAALKSRVLDALTPSATALIATLNKIEAKIERVIAKDERKLEAINAASKALAIAATNKNYEIDRAYKMLHKVSEIAK